MNPAIAKFLAFFSACGFIASILGYIYSFLGEPVDKILFWGFLLLLPAWMAMFVPMYVLEYPQSRTVSFCLKGFARGMPSWVAPCSWLLQLVAVAHLVWCGTQSGMGVPAIVNGQYVLDSRGRILKVLTQAEYLRLREGFARTFSIVMISFYFVIMMYWSFRHGRLQADRTLQSS
jgi:hypothetical protein